MHHNSQKRLQIPGQTYFLTAKTHQSFPYFREEILCKLFVAELEICKKLKKFELFAFCLNYDHFHLLLRPNAAANISEIMRSLKTNFSRNANRVINVSTKATSRDVAFNKHFEKIKTFCAEFSCKHPPHSFPQFKWQKSFHDHAIRNEKDFEKHFNYTVNNFRKHGLPEDWKWYSGNFGNLADEKFLILKK